MSNKEKVEEIIAIIAKMYGLDKNFLTKSFFNSFMGAVRGIKEEEATYICGQVWEILNKK